MTSQPFHTFTKNFRGTDKTHKHAMLKPQEEIDLVNKMHGKNGESEREKAKAREDLILAYLPLARKMAYQASIRGVIPFDDLENSAVEGLAVTVDKFDLDRGARIATLASFEIKSILMRYIMDNTGPTRLGTNFDDKKIFMRLRSKITEIEKNSEQSIREEDLEQIAKELGVKMSAIQRMLPRIFTNDTAISSTDSVEEDDNGATISGFGSSAQIAVPGGQEDREVAMDLSRVFRTMEDRVLSKWSGRNQEIILAYVRNEADTKKLAQLADKFDISIERVRQIWREGREDLRVYLQVNEDIKSVEDISL